MANIGRYHLSLCFLLLLAACVGQSPTSNPSFLQSAVGFGDLPGWNNDPVLEAVPALLKSCDALDKKAIWSPLCRSLRSTPLSTNEQARHFFEHWFQPYAVRSGESDQGLFTGYYEAELHGSFHQEGPYQTPLYARPHDLVTVDLGQFKSDLHGQLITGKVVNGPKGLKLTPYDDRSLIAKGSLVGRAQPLLWVDNPIDAFFLAIQGSGRVRMTDKRWVKVGYDASNSRPYVAIGKILADHNDIGKPVTMQAIRSWMQQHPERASDIMNLNTSYVFFRILTNNGHNEGPLGAEGVVLTPERSLAVDTAYIELGTPVWLDTADGKGNKLQKLVIAQDKGGAIKGIVRGDVFWGYGPAAEIEAGSMQSPGRYFVLLPRSGVTDASF